MITCTLEEYLNKPDTTRLPAGYLEERQNCSIFSQMMDVWGEASVVVEMTRQKPEIVRQELETLHDICSIVYLNPKAEYGLKTELKTAEWELNDYMMGKNLFGYTKESVMEWFNQWCYNVNDQFL